MRRLRMGMVGGGLGSFIGGVHRLAAEMDREIELVAGAFSSDPGRCRIAGETYKVDPDRSYVSWTEMIAGERVRGGGVDFVAIVRDHIIRVANRTFDDFAASGAEASLNRSLLASAEGAGRSALRTRPEAPRRRACTAARLHLP